MQDGAKCLQTWCMSQQGTLRRISSLGALGEGSGWDLRVRPSAAAAESAAAVASGNPDVLAKTKTFVF